MSSFAQRPIEQEYGYTMRSVRQPFAQKFPTIVGILLGLLQMLLNGGIVGLEGASAAFNPKYDIIYAGFWCSFGFFLAWVAIFAFLFFRKTLRWGLFVAGMNLSSMGFAVILIVFDSLFIQYPGQCYLGTVCAANSTVVTNITNIDGKSRIIKAQLALASAMITSNILYVLIFVVIFALTRSSYKPLTPSFQPLPSPPTHSVQTPPYPGSYRLTYGSRYNQPVYVDQTGQWAPGTPYFNRIEKF